MTIETLQRVINLDEEKNSLIRIQRNIFEAGKNHWWGITNASKFDEDVTIPNSIRERFVKLVEDRIKEIDLEIKEL